MRSSRSSANRNLPATVITGFPGTAQVFQESLKGQGILMLAAIFAAYVVLGILYESFIHPITIISGLPSAGIGALLTLMAFKMELSVIAMIGIVMLVGIVKKNAIMMVDFAIERRRVGVGAEAAIREACLLRFRPIMMTTFAAIFGALPIALGAGAGRRAAPAARHRGGRRLVRVAAADALHHAGRLSLSRPHRPAAPAPLEPQLEEVGGAPSGRAPSRRSSVPSEGRTRGLRMHPQCLLARCRLAGGELAVERALFGSAHSSASLNEADRCGAPPAAEG